jgi:hypothetical protein
MHMGRHPKDCWFLMGIEWKIGVIFIEIFLALTAKISRKMKFFLRFIILVDTHEYIL